MNMNSGTAAEQIVMLNNFPNKQYSSSPDKPSENFTASHSMWGTKQCIQTTRKAIGKRTASIQISFLLFIKDEIYFSIH